MRVELRNFTVRFGSVAVVDGVTATLEAGKIHGLLGRNGAGKTTLLSVISAFRRPNGGEVLINGQPPFENAEIVRDICFIRDRLDAQDDDRVSAVLDFARALRPHWDEAYTRRSWWRRSSCRCGEASASSRAVSARRSASPSVWRRGRR
jgi:ABC-2 type transport system ATP-binding protein